ncbi:MAG: TonB-dependent receptor [Pseudomonadota bacterium]
MQIQKRHISFVSVFLILFTSSTDAQTRSADEIDDPDTNSVEVISVTTNRAEQVLTDVNASVSVVTGDLIDQINAQHIQQVLVNVPGTWISRNNGQEHLTAIRSPVLTGPGSCGEFLMALDGISLRAPGFCNVNQLFDANTEQAGQIEVLRGPASTLYGTNAMHGVINIISPNARSENQSQMLELTAGSYDFYKLETDNHWQFGDTDARLLANVTDNGAYISESGYEQQKLTLVFESMIGNWQNKTVIDAAHLNQETAGFVEGFEIFRDQDARRINPNPEAFRDAASLRAYSRFERDDWSITPYLRWNDMTFLQHFLPWQALEENGHKSLGVQVQKTFEGLGATWVSGVDIDYTDAFLEETQEAPFSPTIPAGDHYDYDVKSLQIGGFLQGEWDWDAWQLTVGARLEQVRYDYDNNLTTGTPCGDEVSVCRFSRPESQSVDFENVSPSATLANQLNDNNRVYFKYSQGFRAPQATELFRLQNNQLVVDINEVSMDAVELGWSYFSDGLTLQASIYDMNKEDVIIRDTERQVVIGGETSHQGVELSAQWRVTEQLDLQGALTFQRHEYENDIQISRQSIAGNRIDTAPDRMASLRLNYQASEKASAFFSFQYLDEYYLNPENTAEYDGHELLDVGLKYRFSDELTVQATIFNALDEDYAERADFAFGEYRYFIGLPRRVFVNLQYLY